jgi:primosomal protein N' (replication factor Y)
VVVGGRTAVWAPVPDLAAVIVVDEADEALEDERAPTWNARDVAIERARRAGATTRIVTPAPSVDAVVALGESVAAAARATRPPRWPRVEVVDLRDEEPGRSMLSAALADALRRVLARGERAVCVLNRTGRARLLACNTCRELARCERCGAAVVHDDTEFVCARCATVRPQVCLHCHGSSFRILRPGVARVRDELAALLPRTDVVAADARADPATIQDAAVVIGTEAALHRVDPGAGAPVGLVAYLELDQELLAPRARAAEQALWLIVRGARLLSPRAGALLVQTRLPDHETVRAAAESEPFLVVAAESARRRVLGFPPFGGLAELSGASSTVAVACDVLREQPGVTVLGPVDRVGQDRARALVKAASTEALCDALASPSLASAHTSGSLRVDVDPRRV